VYDFCISGAAEQAWLNMFSKALSGKSKESLRIDFYRVKRHED
jgi:hypothetical protein